MQKVEHEARFRIQSVLIKCYDETRTTKCEARTTKWEACHINIKVGSFNDKLQNTNQTTKCKHQKESTNS
jgi:hypothetical protein